MAVGMGCPMAGLNRVIGEVLAADVPLRRDAVIRAARHAGRRQAPLRRAVADEAAEALVGLGPIEPLLADPEVSDVLVNRADEIWVERGGRLERTDVEFASPEAVVAAVERALLPLGLRLDRASPAVDARLADGSRLHAVIPPAAVDGPVVAIRRFVASALTIEDLIAAGSVDRIGADLLTGLVGDRCNIIVSGATGSGKTTLLNVLSRSIPGDQRVVTVEEAAELRLEGHVVRLEAREPNAEGAGAITVRQLVRQALRMRPDRIVVGEVRGPEAFDLIQAMATGHAGSMGTVHASGASEALWRIETLAAMGASVSHDALRAMLRGTVDIVVHVERRDGRRHVTDICEVGETLKHVWQR